jgi:hypothetical protein
LTSSGPQGRPILRVEVSIPLIPRASASISDTSTLCKRSAGLAVRCLPPERDDLVYVGSVGTGFNKRDALQLRNSLDRLKRKTPRMRRPRPIDFSVAAI